MRKAPLIEMDRGTWGAIALVTATAVVYLTFWFVPQMRAIANSHAELESKLEYVMGAHKSALAADRVEQELREVRAYIEQHDDQLLAEDGMPSLFRQVSHMCKSHEVMTTRFEPLAPVSYHSLERASLSLGVRGPFQSVQRVLHELESLPERVWVDSIKMSRTQEAGDSVQCELRLVVFVDNPENTD